MGLAAQGVALILPTTSPPAASTPRAALGAAPARRPPPAPRPLVATNKTKANPRGRVSGSGGALRQDVGPGTGARPPAPSSAPGGGAPQAPGAGAGRQPQGVLSRLAPALKSYQDRLLQVTTRNRSVLLRRAYMKSNLDLVRLDEFGEGTAAKAVEKAAKNLAAALDGKIDEGARVRLLLDSAGRSPGADAADADADATDGGRGDKKGAGADALRSSLRSLKRSLDQIENETGQHTGYLGYPFLEGSPDAGVYVRGPVALFPMRIMHEKRARGAGWYMRLLDERPVLNRALFAALRKKGGYDLSEGYEEDFDAMIEDAAEAQGTAPAADAAASGEAARLFSAVAGWASGLVDIGDAPAEPGPAALGPLDADAIKELDGSPLRLVGHAVIGSFPQADSEIYRDYAEMTDPARAGEADAGIVGALIEGHGEAEGQDYEADPYEAADAHAVDIDSAGASSLDTVLGSDSSQDEVIVRSASDELCVVRGPPGTGKSQVIVNLVANALSSGQKVLVVCQKRSALEVVRQRLGRVGLADYAVFIERELADRRRMYEQLLATIEADAHEADVSEADRRVADVSRRIDGCIEFLVGLGAALRERHFGGASAHDLYASTDGSYEPAMDIASLNLPVEWGGLDEFVDRIAGVEDAYRRFDAPGSPWAGRRSFADMGSGDAARLRGLLDRMIAEAPGCAMAPDEGRQRSLRDALDGYLAGGGLLGLRRRGHAKAIRAELGAGAAADRAGVEARLPGVEAGLRMWGMVGELAGHLGDGSAAREGLLRDAAAAPPGEPPAQLARTLAAMRSALDEFEAMRDLDLKRADYAGQGVFEALAHADGRLPGAEGARWAPLVRQEVCRYWLDEIERRSRLLRGDFVAEYDRRRADLAALMSEKGRLVTEKIRQSIDGAVRPGSLRGRRGRGGGGPGPAAAEWMELRRELSRKRRVMPVRRLFERYGGPLLQIAPCWLASPESVSRIFPLKRGMFDLAIVDEASQLAAERAMPFLYRARRAVVAGDEKQLPPFDLFRIRGDEDEDEYDGGDGGDGGGPPPEKSLLELAAARYGHTTLSWHYRSVYQDLINFSNHAFYAGMLNVAPNAASDPEHPPIRWVRCSGVWEKRRNRVEAERVLDEVAAEWERSRGSGAPYRSVGVITFNEAQQELVMDRLDRRLEDDAAFAELHAAAHESAGRDDKLFVKNIENVQGDERDVIVFSIWYARDADGKFANRFGTLSARGGENRLNVAVTRARQEMVVVSSIDPADVRPTPKNDGPLRLRQFLEYARATGSADRDAQEAVISSINPSMSARGRGGAQAAGRRFDSEFEVQVHTALERRGHRVDTQVGFSGYRIDLAVLHPDDENRYVLGIECDGASFHSARSVRERDVMRQQFLEGKGWSIERVWSRRWWSDSEAEVDRLDRRISELVEVDRRRRRRPGSGAAAAGAGPGAPAGEAGGR